MVQLIIDITSDLACPWCYVGLKRLENAIAEFEDEPLKVYLRWHPYILDMNTEKNGEDYSEYNQRRSGSDDWVRRIKREALDDGATFRNWGDHYPSSVWANSFHAHRLLYFVRTRCSWDRMDKMARKLFDEYYESGKNISLIDELIWIGKKLKLSVPDDNDNEWHGGITNTELEVLLHSESLGYSEVLREDTIAKRMAISGLPYFEVSGDAFNGAQSTHFWIRIFQKILDRR